MINLRAGDYQLELDPERGGSVARFEWRDEHLFRPTGGASILDTGCFPLVPFSNRIADGRFSVGEQEIRLSPNLPGSSEPHAIHGFGWHSVWEVTAADVGSAVLVHDYPGGEWPWRYRAEQHFTVDEDGLRLELRVLNLGETAMPVGLGIHPYFPRDENTIYHGLHRGEWRNDAECLPQLLDDRDEPLDWWEGKPVHTRSVDTVYVGRDGPLTLHWPRRDLTLVIKPSNELLFTVVYVPPDADFLCVEPVSHATNAVNASIPGSGLRWIEKNEECRAHVDFHAHRSKGELRA